MIKIFTNKKGSEMLQTIIVIAILGTLFSSIAITLYGAINKNNEHLIPDMEKTPIIINK